MIWYGMYEKISNASLCAISFGRIMFVLSPVPKISRPGAVAQRLSLSLVVYYLPVGTMKYDSVFHSDRRSIACSEEEMHRGEDEQKDLIWVFHSSQDERVKQNLHCAGQNRVRYIV